MVGGRLIGGGEGVHGRAISPLSRRALRVAGGAAPRRRPPAARLSSRGSRERHPPVRLPPVSSGQCSSEHSARDAQSLFLMQNTEYNPKLLERG